MFELLSWNNDPIKDILPHKIKHPTYQNRPTS